MSSAGAAGGSGPGRERVLHAVAGGHGADPLARGHGEARPVQELDAAARHHRFSLSLLGTFLVRSGVLVSVHAFASDPSRGLFILGFLGVCVGGSLALFAWRGPSLRTKGGFEIVSRESFLLGNNALLLVAAALILIGTLYRCSSTRSTWARSRWVRRTSTPCS